MNKLLLFSAIYLIGMNLTYGREANEISVSNSIQILIVNDYHLIVSQVPLDRKVQRLMSCEREVYKLPLDASYIRGTLVPQIAAERLILAPNYPETNEVFGAAKEALISDWILNYESEYDQFIVYYETLVRSHT